MKRALFWHGLLFAAAFPYSGHTDETSTLTPNSVAAFGTMGGDTFGIERISKDSVVVLVRPSGEDCTLRFPINIGESLSLRADGQSMLCQASLVSTDQDKKAQFSARCTPQISSNERKCPPQSSSANATPR